MVFRLFDPPPRPAPMPMWKSGLGGWECPKCGRVWAGTVQQCKPCNDKVAEKEREARET